MKKVQWDGNDIMLLSPIDMRSGMSIRKSPDTPIRKRADMHLGIPVGMSYRMISTRTMSDILVFRRSPDMPTCNSSDTM